MERNLTAHEPASPLPCLCRQCVAAAPERVVHDGVSYERLEVRAASRVLHAWYPSDLADEAPRLQASMERQLGRRLAPRFVPPPQPVLLPVERPERPGLFSRFRRFLGL